MDCPRQVCLRFNSSKPSSDGARRLRQDSDLSEVWEAIAALESNQGLLLSMQEKITRVQQDQSLLRDRLDVLEVHLRLRNLSLAENSETWNDFTRALRASVMESSTSSDFARGHVSLDMAFGQCLRDVDGQCAALDAQISALQEHFNTLAMLIHRFLALRGMLLPSGLKAWVLLRFCFGGWFPVFVRFSAFFRCPYSTITRPSQP